MKISSLQRAWDWREARFQVQNRLFTTAKRGLGDRHYQVVEYLWNFVMIDNSAILLHTLEDRYQPCD